MSTKVIGAVAVLGRKKSKPVAYSRPDLFDVAGVAIQRDVSGRPAASATDAMPKADPSGDGCGHSAGPFAKGGPRR